MKNLCFLCLPLCLLWFASDSLIQYNSDNKQWSSNVRFNIIHRPLSAIFLVYNEHRDSLRGNLIDRALIAKMTYMISR
jgi:hypothetical protein